MICWLRSRICICITDIILCCVTILYIQHCILCSCIDLTSIYVVIWSTVSQRLERIETLERGRLHVRGQPALRLTCVGVSIPIPVITFEALVLKSETSF
jgi:hypothetical protein